MSQAGLARHSLSVAQWTLLSRLTGFARTATVAAVLGPTYLGNTYQAMNAVPNLVFEMLTGSLLAALLVPALVGRVDSGDAGAVKRVAGGFLGLALAVIGVVTAVGVLAAPLVVGLFSSSVPDAAVAADQRRVGVALLVMFLPQVALYTIAGVSGAVMNARGRFALAAAAPAVENLGVMLTMAAVVSLFGTGLSVSDAPTGQLLVLGFGTTAAVALHALTAWIGAYRSGTRLLPKAGWRDPDVRSLVRRTVPSLGYAALNALRFFAALVVANRVAGGVVAFYLALNFFYLPTAIGARPLAVALLPRLSRLKQAGALVEFRDEYLKGLGRTAFVTIPAAMAYAALAVPLAEAASFGALSSERGVDLLSAALIGLALGVIGEGVFVMSTHAAYAFDAPGLAFRAMVVRALVSLTGQAIVLAVADGATLLVLLGLAISVGDLASACYLTLRVRARLPRGTQRLAPALVRASGAGLVMIAPAYLVARALSAAPFGELAAVFAMVVAGFTGILIFVAVQRAFHSPELSFFTSALPWRRAEPQ